MPPPAAVPKSFWGPPARDPPPSWVIPASRRTPQHASIHFRGFSGEFDFSIPNEEMAAITHRIIQGEQALQMHHCQIQSWQYQMGLLQTQAQIQQLQLLSQSSQVSQTQKLVYQIGHCRNPRIGLEIVGGPDLVHHWLMIIDAWITLKGLHDHHQELHGRITHQFLNNPHRWFHSMDYFIILLVPVIHWLKPMCFGKLQQCLRWQQLSVVHTKVIRFLNINIILILAYNCGRYLRWRYFAAHYWFQIWSKLTGSHCTIW